MQLHEVFAADDAAAPPTKRHHVRMMAPKKNGPPKDVPFLFVIVDEPDTSTAIRDAERAIRAEYRDKEGAPLPIPETARSNEQVYQLLFRAMRDTDDHRRPLAQSVLELRRAIPPVTARRLMTAYNEFFDAENPDTITAEGLAELEDAAAGESERDRR